MREVDLFVIGGGSAGVRCARISAGHGATVAVAEERFWGGTCVNVGCVPKKVMVQAAEYRAAAEDARGFGWSIEVHGHDWAALKTARDAEIARLSSVYRTLLERAGAAWFEARARLLDAHTVEVGGERIHARHIVIATGGQPDRVQFPGSELALISDDLFTLETLPRRVVVVGGGYIGVEYAGLLHGLGALVTVVHRGTTLLRGFDTEIRTGLTEAMTSAGIEMRMGATPVSLERRADGSLLLRLDAGQPIEADAVFLATGRVPSTRGIGLEEAGIATSPTGAILVDEEQRTSVPHIYALGDVTDRLNLTPVATAQGHALADTLFGGRKRRASLANVPTAVFSVPPIATVGLTEEEAARLGPADVYVTRFTPMRHAMSRRSRRSLLKLVVDPASDRVLGVHMLGDDAPEIVQGFAVALTAGATKAQFDATIGIHPTAAEEFVTLRTLTRRVGHSSAAAD